MSIPGIIIKFENDAFLFCRLGDLAKQFNAAHLTKMAMKPPSGIGVEAKPNPTMDHLTFTPDELVCLLRYRDLLPAAPVQLALVPKWPNCHCYGCYSRQLLSPLLFSS